MARLQCICFNIQRRTAALIYSDSQWQIYSDFNVCTNNQYCFEVDMTAINRVKWKVFNVMLNKENKTTIEHRFIHSIYVSYSKQTNETFKLFRQCNFDYWKWSLSQIFEVMTYFLNINEMTRFNYYGVFNVF